MNEGGQETQAGSRLSPDPWNSISGEIKGRNTWLEEQEKRIMHETRAPELKIPKDVLRKEHGWEKFGWSENGKERVENRVKEVLKLDELLDLDPEHNEHDKHHLDGKMQNVMHMLLASGKKPEEILEKFTSERLQEYVDQIMDPSKRRTNQPMSTKERAMSQVYFIQEITEDEKHENYLERFVYNDVFNEELFNEYQRSRPKNLYELAWQITASEKEMDELFGVNGKYPILEMRVDTDDNQNVKGGRYTINQANMVRWIRERIMYWQDQEPDSYVDYFKVVQLEKDLGSIHLENIIHDHTLFFTDETGQYFEGLSNQILLESSNLASMRQYHFLYLASMASEKKLVEEYGKMFADNKFTKKTFGKTRMYYNSVIPLDFDGKDSDTTLGSAANTMFLAMYNFSDYDHLREILGDDSSFFTREGMQAAMEEQLKKRFKNAGVGSQDLGTFLGSEAQKNFEAAFSKKGADGKISERVNYVVDKNAFTKFVNYFAAMGPNHNLKDVVRGALKNAVGAQYNFHSKEYNGHGDHDKPKIDEYSLDVAALNAESQTLYTGAGAKNDPGAAGFNGLSKLLNTENYRRKMATEKRGNAMGNPLSVPQFKMMSLDFLRAIRVAEATKKDKNGTEVERTKTAMEVMEEMRYVEMHHRSTRTALENEIASYDAGSDQRKAKQKELGELNAAANIAYKKIAGQLEFNENTMVNYVANHLARGQKIYEQVMGAQELNFDKFTKYDPITHSMSFDRPQFQKEIQEDFNKQLRYMFETYGHLNLAMNIRTSVFEGRDAKGNDIWVEKTVPLGQAMLGYEVLNIEPFRKKENGKNVIDANGDYVIDYGLVDQNKTLVWKQMALMKIGADLVSHIDKNLPDPKYTIGYFWKVREAIESIPSEVIGDERDINGTVVAKNLFSKEQMKWLAEWTKTTNFRMYLRGIWQDSRKRADGGISDSFSMFLSAVFRGY